MGFRDAVTSAGPYANNLHLAPDTNTSSLNSYRPDALPGAQPTVSSRSLTAMTGSAPKLDSGTY